MAYQGGKLSDGTPLNVAVYRAYKNAGLSHSQAMAITAEVGRENDFRGDILFGNHTDPARDKNGNKIRNLGMLSWNQGRDINLERFLNQKGVMRNGQMAKNQENLNAQAQFSVGEMKTPRYASKLKNFWNNPNASPEAYAKELGKGYIVWAYGQNDVKGKVAGTRVPFDWKANNNRRKGHLGDLGGMIGDKTNYSQPQQQQAPDPRLSMSAPDLLATIRKGKDKRTDLQILYELSNNNGLAGREINGLLARGESLGDIASQLGLKVPNNEPQATQQPDIELPDIGEGYDDFMANLAPQDASNEPDIQMPDVGKGYDDFMSNLQTDEQHQPQQFPELGSDYQDFMSNLKLDDSQQQVGETWQTQNESLETTLSPKSEKAQPTLKSSWESQI